MAEETTYRIEPIVGNEKIGVLLMKQRVLGGNDAMEFTHVLQSSKELNLSMLVVDMSEVDLINSSGLGMLVSGMSTSRKQGTTFALIQIPPKVMNLLEVTHLNQIFKIFQNIEEAISFQESDKKRH